MKILYVTTIGGTMRFFKTFIKELIDAGHTVDIATNTNLSPVASYYSEWGCKVHKISCSRSPLEKNTLKAISEIKKIVSDNQYDIVHCHTPIAAMCTRLACRKARKKGTKVFYTAHGFHFYKKAPFKNWMMFFPIEWLCSFMTDKIITINKEDFVRAQKRMHAKNICYVPGVGFETDNISTDHAGRESKRKELGILDDSIAVLSVGELNANKNHEVILKAISKLEDKNIVYVICGKGNKKEYLESLAKELGIEKQLILAGYRTDVAEIYKSCDIFAFPSKREGLPVSVMEAMASGLPCVVSDIRGNRDLVLDGENGFLCKPTDVDSFSEKICKLAENPNMRESMAFAGKTMVKKFDQSSVMPEMKKIYGIVGGKK